MGDLSEPVVLRKAAAILRREATKPHSIFLGVVCRTLEDLAQTLDIREEGARG